MTMATLKCLLLMTCYLLNYVLGIAVDVQKDLDFTKCLTSNQALFIKGIESIVGTSDPLSIDSIPGHLPDLEYKVRNATLTGMKECVVAKMRANKEKSTFDYNLECPRIDFKAKYFLKGYLGNIPVASEGDVTVTTGLYILSFHGYYDKKVGEDKKEHAHIRNYYLDFDARENLVFKFGNLDGGDKVKTDTLNNFINENWRFMDKQLRAPILYGFMDVFIQNLNDYLKAVPIVDLFKTSC